jgi:hypothetical protein
MLGCSDKLLKLKLPKMAIKWGKELDSGMFLVLSPRPLDKKFYGLRNSQGRGCYLEVVRLYSSISAVSHYVPSSEHSGKITRNWGT